MELNQLLEQLDESLQALPDNPERSVVLGYSGGVDSEVLAFILAEYAKQHPHMKVRLIYVHHGLSVNADDWQQHCQMQAEQYQLPFIAKQVEVEQGARKSLEAEARKVRYQAFKQEMHAGDVLLTAHHQDDQLETLLLALKRGQGPKGLSAMAEQQPLDDGFWQLRPLLNFSKQQIIDFAAQHKLKHIEDESNQDTQFERNFLRQDIIPLLKQRWPAIALTASRSAKLCTEQQQLLNEISQEKVAEFIQTSKYANRVFNLHGFYELSPAWQRQLFRTFLDIEKLPIPSKVQLDEILKQLLYAKEDAQVNIKVSGLVVRRFKQQVFCWSYLQNDATDLKDKTIEISQILSADTKKVINLSAREQLSIKLIDKSILASGNAGVRLPVQQENVSLRFSLSGNYLCYPHFRHKPRKLNKLWQELDVPPWIRRRIPLIFYNEKLVAAAGLWVEKSAQEFSEKCVAFDVHFT